MKNIANNVLSTSRFPVQTNVLKKGNNTIKKDVQVLAASMTAKALAG